MAGDTTSNGFDYSGQLSKKAIQLLRELQGLKLFDQERGSNAGADAASAMGSMQGMAEPVLGGSPMAPAIDIGRVERKTSKRDGKTKLLARFNRETYLGDTRGSQAGTLVAATLVLAVVLVVSLGASWRVLTPMVASLEEQVGKISSAPGESAQIQQQIQQKTQQKADAGRRLDVVKASFLDKEASLAVYTSFLAVLREGRVSLLSQRNSIDQTIVNPFVAAGKAGAPKNAPAPVAKVTVVPGLNHNHYELRMSGSYMGYMFARQTLVSSVPSLLVHYEEMGAMDQDPSQLNIKLYISIPFLAK